MTQQAPSTLFYAQAMKLVADLKREFLNGNIKTVDDISVSLQSLVTEFKETAGKPLTVFEPIVDGEPPSSRRLNEIWNNMSNDLNILHDHVDVLRSTAVSIHNLITTEILRAQRENQRASNKLKALQLYSTAQDSNMVILGDYFKDGNFIDNAFTSAGQRASIDIPGHLTLSPTGTTFNYSNSSQVKVLDTSNGFPGNNHEVKPGADNTKEQSIVFYAEQDRNAAIASIVDGSPTTRYEYEYNFVYPGDRFIAKNYNFTYINDKPSSTSEPIDWAIGPSDGILKLDLEFDLGAVKQVNQVSLIPYGLTENVNTPIKITRIQVSPNSTNWTVISDKDIWVGTNTNLDSLHNADNISLNSAVWPFSQLGVRYVRISIEQPNPITSNLGHLYYIQTTEQEQPPASSGSDFVESATPDVENDFENLVSGEFEKWKTKDSSEDSLTVTQSNVHYHYASHSVKLQNTEAGQDDYIYRNISANKIRPSTKYVFSAWCYVSTLDDPALNRRGLYVGAAKDGKPLKFLGQTKIKSTHTTGEWVRHEVVVTTPRRFTSINLRLYAPKGTTYWDEVRFAPAVLASDQTNNLPSISTRKEGPNPPLSNPTVYYKPNSQVSRGLVQHREFFEGKRWAIGLRDIGISFQSYKPSGVMVSRPFKAGGLIDRIALEADVETPSTFPADVSWVNFFVSPDDGLTWIPISRIQDDFVGIPEVIAFNDPLPVEFRETGVYYYDSSKPVDSLRVKIELARPSANDASSPIVKSYKLKMRRR